MLPTKKTSKSRTRTRRAHHALRAPSRALCPKCNMPRLPHAACGNCGYVSSKVMLPQKQKES
ncbi:MAG: 50S ribosomal protein L32 [Phycisphaerae bacterium]|nr:50S ribosomal protein L32 [Phycisphaerae bacterium]